jgi:hypothetical protein
LTDSDDTRLETSPSLSLFSLLLPRLQILPSFLITIVSECPLFSLPLLIPFLAGKSLHQVVYYLSRIVSTIVFSFCS